jgi:2-phosphoglycerate kinase
MGDRGPEQSWLVLLIGGLSASGKTVAAKRFGLSLGVPWMQVDDLRLAFQRAHASLPSGTDALYFFLDTPNVWRRQPEELRDALIAVGDVMSAPLEVVIEHHVDTATPLIVEGDGILPSLLFRPSVRERAAKGAVRAVFLVEPDEPAILRNMLDHGRGTATQAREESRTEARAKWLFGQWLAEKAMGYGLPVIEPRPWETLAARISTHSA